MKSIVLIGSSIFEAWTRATTLLPDCQISIRAIGGTTTSDWIRLLPDVLAATSPHVVLFYCGSNDLCQEVPSENVLANVLRCRTILHQKSPAIRLAYFGIIKAPQKAGKWEVIDSLNESISARLRPGDLYVDSNAVFFRNGAPVTRYFLEDGLHLTDEAYADLTGYAAPIVEHWLSF